MKLSSFRVRVFRNVIDSGPIKVGDNTCLVGKNEAGKSAIIEALHRLNPAKPVPLSLLDDYPRWLKKAHEISGEINKAVPITATFALSTDEISEIETRFGSVLQRNEIEVSRKYDGNDFALDVPLKMEEYVREFVENYAPAVIQPLLAKIKTPSDLFKELSEIADRTSSDKEPTPEAQAAKQVAAKLSERLGGAASLTGAVHQFLRPLVPKTFYFNQYSQLRGRYSLDEVIAALQNGSDDEEIQAAADFLTLARIAPTNIEAWDFEASNAELEAISSLLTQRVRTNWKQNKHLKLIVKIESIPDQARNPKRFLQFRVEDTRHDFSSRLDRRSTGFRWFVSFVASFFEFEKDNNIVLLLDEPGLSLHARAQKDLLDAIDNHLTIGRQVIYTTHSPFMVRTEALQRARIVEDRGPEIGSNVTNEAGITSDPDTLFPLQAALGYDIAQNLFIGNRNILVEGTSDVLYLAVMSSHLGGLGRKSLPDNVRLLPSGGATNIPTFLALLGGQLEIVVLLDGNAQRQRIDNAIASGKLNASRVFSIDNFVSIPGADIEDLFEPAEYLALYNATFAKSLKAKDLKGSDRIVKRIARREGGDFDHGRVAAHFLMNQGSVIPTLSAATIERFEAVFGTLSKALPVVP
ncbi:MAG: AAA family ATPase [Candidatus Manganitrophus sp. SA1]|nr:AAA family ATPase [Candidatus Manganitrophus morganii]